MNRSGEDSTDRPTPEHLAAYTGGTLGPEAAARVARWLAPPEPRPEAWDRVWANVAVAAAPVRVARPYSWPRRLAVLVALALPTTAAAILLATSFPRLPDPVPPRPLPVEETLDVAREGDVELVSVRNADAEAIVVGKPLLNEPLALATAADVRVDDLKPAPDGMVPFVPTGPGPDAPMVVAPMPR